MNGLSQDPVCLRVILAYLNKLLADEETVVTYLRLQRDAVRAALVRAEGAPAPSAGPPSRNGHRPPMAPPFTPNRAKHQITANDARAALLDPNMEECPFCRPKTELGMLD